jgi:hypothetical protein
MTDDAIMALGILLIVAPAALGWYSFLRWCSGFYIAHHERRQARWIARDDHWTHELNQQLIARAAIRSRSQRKRELRAITGGRGANCERVQLGPDGPRAA